MKANAVILILLTAFLTLAGAGIFIVRDHFTSQQLPVLATAAEFKLTDQDGNLFSSAVLNGKVWIGNFFFSSCEGVCPTVNGSIARLAERIKNSSQAQFVSISVDPATDTVPVIKAYAAKFKADPERWHFLTGPEEQVSKILVAFKLGSSDKPIEHTSRLVLVDGAGQVRGYYQGTDEDAFLMLERDLEKLSR